MSYSSHQKSGQSIIAHCAIITLSDTRTPQTDTSGQTITRLLTAAGHSVAAYDLLPDNPVQLDNLLSAHLARGDVDLIITNGGTGISPRDQTIPTVEKHLQTLLPGFGELFRMLSWQQIASGAMLSRAVAGIHDETLLFALPGSTKAVELALERLILPEIGHLLAEVRKKP